MPALATQGPGGTPRGSRAFLVLTQNGRGQEGTLRLLQRLCCQDLQPPLPPNSWGVGAAGPSQDPACEPVNSKTLTQRESALSQCFCSQWNSGEKPFTFLRGFHSPGASIFQQAPHTGSGSPAGQKRIMVARGKQEGAPEDRNQEAKLTDAGCARPRLRNHYVSNKERKYGPAESGPGTSALKSLSSPEARGGK